MSQNQTSPEAGNQPGSKDTQANQDLLHNAPIGVFKATPEGRHLFANPALARMYGYDSPDELIAAVSDMWIMYQNLVFNTCLMGSSFFRPLELPGTFRLPCGRADDNGRNRHSRFG